MPVALQSGGKVRYPRELTPVLQWDPQNLLIRRQQPASFSSRAAPVRSSRGLPCGARGGRLQDLQQRLRARLR